MAAPALQLGIDNNTGNHRNNESLMQMINSGGQEKSNILPALNTKRKLQLNLEEDPSR